jgi:2-dehydropantoate 2-reductase
VKIGVIGAGAVGGYYAARFALAGHDVTVVARGAHLEAIQSHGLVVRTGSGVVAAHVRAHEDASRIGACDLVLFAVKAYDNATALPLLGPLTGPSTTVLTLQNGVDSPSDAAAVVGASHVLGGAAYIATAIVAPGVIEQTGAHHRVVFGEVFEPEREISRRAGGIRDAFIAAGVDAEAHPDGRVPLWEKFVYLAPFAGLTGAARLPIGPLAARRETSALLERAFAEVDALARAEGVPVARDLLSRIRAYVGTLPSTTRSSLLIDLQAGKRIEVEALQGTVVRRARALGVDVPVMETLYAVLREHARVDLTP